MSFRLDSLKDKGNGDNPHLPMKVDLGFEGLERVYLRNLRSPSEPPIGGKEGRASSSIEVPVSACPCLASRVLMFLFEGFR